MSELEFDDSQSIHTRSIDISNAVSHNTPYLVKRGLVKNLQQANTVMFTIFVLCIIGCFIVIIIGFQKDELLYQDNFTQNEIDRMHPDIRNGLPTRK
jgi:cell division protein FtsL